MHPMPSGRIPSPLIWAPSHLRKLDSLKSAAKLFFQESIGLRLMPASQPHQYLRLVYAKMASGSAFLSKPCSGMQHCICHASGTSTACYHNTVCTRPPLLQSQLFGWVCLRTIIQDSRQEEGITKPLQLKIFQGHKTGEHFIEAKSCNSTS